MVYATKVARKHARKNVRKVAMKGPSVYARKVASN